MIQFTGLEGIQHIRKRPGMYVGERNLRGFKVLLSYLFDDILMDEDRLIQLSITFEKEDGVYIEVENSDLAAISETLSNFDKEIDAKKWPLGFPTLIALTEETHIGIHNFPSYLLFSAKKGLLEHVASTSDFRNPKLDIRFKLEDTIFRDCVIDYESMYVFLQQYAFLHPNLSLKVMGNRSDSPQSNRFYFPKGIAHQLDLKIMEQKHQNLLFRLDLHTIIDNYAYRISLGYQPIWIGQSYICSFANNDEMFFGGSLQEGVINGIFAATKKLAQPNSQRFLISKPKIREQLMVIAAVKGNDFSYEGAIRAKLAMPNMQKEVKAFVYTELLYFFENKQELIPTYLEKYTIWE